MNLKSDSEGGRRSRRPSGPFVDPDPCAGNVPSPSIEGGHPGAPTGWSFLLRRRRALERVAPRKGTSLGVNMGRGALQEMDGLRRHPSPPKGTSAGLKVLGVPVGRPGEVAMHEKLWSKRVAELQGACDTLSGVPDPQLHHCLLRQCLAAA